LRHEWVIKLVKTIGGRLNNIELTVLIFIFKRRYISNIITSTYSRIKENHSIEKLNKIIYKMEILKNK